MESIELEKIGLLELNAEEQKEVDAGGFWAWLGAGLAYDILSGPTAAGNAFSNGFNQWK